MIDTPLVALTLAICGTMTLLILARALRDVLFRDAEDDHKVEG